MINNFEVFINQYFLLLGAIEILENHIKEVDHFFFQQMNLYMQIYVQY